MILQLGTLGVHLTAIEVSLPGRHQLTPWLLLDATAYNTGTGRAEEAHFQGGQWTECTNLGSDSIELAALLNERLSAYASMRTYRHLISQQVAEAQATLADARTALAHAAADEVWARSYQAAALHRDPRVHDVAITLLREWSGTPEELLAAAEGIVA